MKKPIPLFRFTAGLSLLGLSLAARADYPSTVLTDHPAGYWRLDTVPWVSYATNAGSAGSAANGVVGSWVHEGAAGAIAGDTDTAMLFTGNGNARISIPYAAELNPDPAAGHSFTWEGWIKSGVLKGESLGVVVNRNGESGYVIYIQSDSSLVFNLNRGPGGGYWTGVSIPAADYTKLASHWLHLACVYDVAGGEGYGAALIYTNGVLCASNSIPDALPLANDGGAMTLGDRNYAGWMDEVAVYPSALGAAKLRAHYLAGTSGAGNYRATVLGDQPAGYWRLGETNGTATPPTLAANRGSLGTAADGFAGGGVAFQAAGALGATDAAAGFTGGNVQVPYNVELNPEGPFTVEFWAYKKSGSGYPLGAMSSMYYTGGNARNGWLFYDAGADWEFRLGDGDGYVATAKGGTADVGTWQHLAGVYDGTNALLYTNGVLAASTPLSRSYAPNLGLNLELGSASAFGRYFAGTLDEVAIYPRALSAAELLAHRQAAASPATYAAQIEASQPAGYWRLDDVAPGGVVATNFGWLASAGNGTFSGTSLVVTNDSPLVGDTDSALYFPGSGRIDFPWNEALVRTNAFSYEIWYKEDPGVTGVRSPFWWRDEPATGDTRGWVHYVSDMPEGRGHVFQTSSTASTWDGLSVAPLSFVQDAWQHLVCTWDGTVKKIYLDGALVQVSTNDPRFIKLVERPACSISSANYPFVGFLDEAAYYTNALPAERVVAHYVAARGVAPVAVAPAFRVDAASVSSYEGARITIPTIVLGTSPFTYQWYKGAAALAGQTNATLTLAAAKVSDSGDYTLTVRNAAGSASSQVATVVIEQAPPSILAQPVSATRVTGASVTFAVSASGSQPLHYQWLSNSIAIPGANAAVLVLSQVQPADAANYTVVITNVAGTTTSAAASLTVVPVASGSLAAAVAADQAVAYWRLDEASGATAAHDYAGGYDGTYDPTVVLGQPGALVGDSDTSASFSYGGITVPYRAELNPAAAFSLEAWVKVDPSSAGMERPILWSINSYQGWAYGYQLAISAADAWAFTTGQKTSGFDTLEGGSATNAGWTHLVCTFDDASGDKRLYVNGTLALQTSTPAGTFGGNPAEGTLDNPVPIDQGIGWNIAAYSSFVGGLDDVAVYNYALSATQVKTHYAKGIGAVVVTPTLEIARSGANTVLTWTQGLLLQAGSVTGPWTTNSTAVSPWTNALSQGQQFYRVFVP